MFISYTQLFRATYRALVSKVTCLLNYLKKIAVGEGWGILSVGRIQLAFYLEIAGGNYIVIYG